MLCNELKHIQDQLYYKSGNLRGSYNNIVTRTSKNIFISIYLIC